MAHPSREQCLYIAELAGEAERFDDVVTQIKTIIMNIDQRLALEERNLLSVAYKNITNNLRASWRIVDTLEKVQAARSKNAASRQLQLIRHQREIIEKELTNVCKDIVELLDKQLLPYAQTGEEQVFYSKMKGDYYRYLAEFAQKHEREKFGDYSLNAYKIAYQRAVTTLDPVHPTRLGLALNFSVFYHDVRKSPERACFVAKSAFDDAISVLEGTDPSQSAAFRDSLMILQLLKDDLLLWADEMKESD
ncbi:14-3-3 protein [Schizophyllum commune Tattone D]|nr:14-3-3 protein [Schizophyllum commune Loenen D]KAI5834530.1 14-3-3 protein [Schizophyllum commune Tattone D]